MSGHWARRGAAIVAAGLALASPASGQHGGHGGVGGHGGFGGRSGTVGHGSHGSIGSAGVRSSRGGRGTLGGYFGRTPSSRGSFGGGAFFGGGRFGHGSVGGFYLSPFGYGPFFTRGWGYSYYGTGSRYGYRDDWSDQGNVQLRVEPKDVEVYVDGTPWAKGGRAVLALPAGRHRVEIARPGYRPWAVDLDVQQGVRYRLERRLERLSREEQERGLDRPSNVVGEPARLGELRLDVQPADTIVNMDGRLLGMVDLLKGSKALKLIPLGRHTLRFTRPGYKTVEREIEVSGDQPAEVTVDLERE